MSLSMSYSAKLKRVKGRQRHVHGQPRVTGNAPTEKRRADGDVLERGRPRLNGKSGAAQQKAGGHRLSEEQGGNAPQKP